MRSLANHKSANFITQPIWVPTDQVYILGLTSVSGYSILLREMKNNDSLKWVPSPEIIREAISNIIEAFEDVIQTEILKNRINLIRNSME